MNPLFLFLLVFSVLTPTIDPLLSLFIPYLLFTHTLLDALCSSEAFPLCRLFGLR